MKRAPMYKLLKNIEQEAEDDYAMLQSVGPEFFPSSALFELRGRCKEKLIMFDRLQKVGILTVASSPMWLVVGCIFGTMGWYALASLALFLFPICITFFVLTLIFLKAYFGSKNHLEHCFLQVDQELSKRQNALIRKRRQS